MEEEKVVDVEKSKMSKLDMGKAGVGIITESACLKLVDNIVNATMPANVKLGGKILTKIGGCLAGTALNMICYDLVVAPAFKNIEEFKQKYDEHKEKLASIKEEENFEEVTEDLVEA